MSARRPASPVFRERIDHYVDRAAAYAAAHRSDPGWLADMRAAAIARFTELGFPSTRLEEWRYTNMAPIAKLALEARDDGATPAIDAPPEADVATLGAAIRETPSALRARLGRLLDAKDRPFALLNAAFAGQGALVRIPRGVALMAPVRLGFASCGDGGAHHPRILVTAEAGSQATVVLDFFRAARPGEGATGPGLTNAVIEVDVAENAQLVLVAIQRESAAQFHVSNAACRVARDGLLTSHTLSVRGALVRNDLEVVLDGEGAECELRGLFVGTDSRLVDNHTFVDHAMPHGRSRELYKGVLGGSSRGIFRGRVLVRPDAQKTDATQSNPNLLLGEGAEIDTKPQLEIYADDVRCAHGATVGQLDADALFYLRSRGIDVTSARELLIRAFASEIVESIPENALAPAAQEAIAEALQAAIRGDAS
jgi:Fe-S cluster assembly protein SufD